MAPTGGSRRDAGLLQAVRHRRTSPRPGSLRRFTRWLSAKPRELGESFEPSFRGTVEDPEQGVEGICCSGGGIRSSAFNLGALQRLSESGHLARADYLAAVSGGSYIAAAFSMVAPRGGPKAGEPGPFAPGTPEEQFLRNRTGYMAPSGVDLIALVWRFLVGALATFALVAIPLFIGFFALTEGVFEPQYDLGKGSFAIPDGAVYAVIAIGSLAVILGLLSMATQLQDACVRWAARLLPLLAVVAVVFVGMPALRDWLGTWSTTGTIGISGTTLAFLGGALGLVRELLVPKDKSAGAGGRLSVSPQMASRLRVALARLAGAVLGPVLILAAGYGAISLALAHEMRWWAALGLALGAAFAYYVLFYRRIDLTGLSMHRVYRRRLASAFALERVRGDDGELRACPREMRSNPVRLSECCFAGEGWPTLVVCAAANISDVGATPRGREVTSFTFSATTVGSPLVGAFYTPTFEEGLDSNNRMQDGSLMAAVAMSGAALAPSMGKLTNKSLTFLMALTNVRLGVWVPSPRPGNAVDRSYEKRAEVAWKSISEDGSKRSPRKPRSVPIRGFGKPRAKYLARELLGLNYLDSDYLYVTDGGHYENLGLVELLRRGCTRIWCFDASGGADAQELGDAIAIARAEIGVEIEIDPEPLFGEDPPESACVRGTFTYADGVGGTLLYCKNVLRAGSPWDVKSLAQQDGAFPDDSTADQLFSEQRFEGYRVLGWDAAADALKLSGARPARLPVERDRSQGSEGADPSPSNLASGLKPTPARTEEVAMTDQMNQAGSAPQPGWYQDPSGPGYRWWDGTSWTDQTHPGTQQQAAAPAPAPTPAAPAAPAATTPAVAQSSAKPAKKKNTPGASNWLNENPLPVVLILAVLLAIVVVLFVL